MIGLWLRRHQEFLCIAVVSLLYALLNIIHVILAWVHRPENTIFIGITHWYEDYFFYLSQVRQGIDGAWLPTISFSSEAIPASLNWSFNVMLGKIGGLFGLMPWTIYTLSLFAASLISLVLIYIVIREVFPESGLKRIAAFLVAISANGFFWIESSGGRTSIVPYEYFYNYTASLNRLGGVVHLIAQNILSLALIFLFAKNMEKERVWRLILMAATTALLFIINPVYVAVDALIVGLASLWYIRTHPSKPVLIKLIRTILVVFVPVIPLFIYTNTIFSHEYYQYFRTWEASIPSTDIPTFLLSTGIIGILVLLGIVSFLKHPTPLRVMGVLFVFIPILLYFSPIPSLLHIPSFRILEPPAYVFLAAIAVSAVSKRMIPIVVAVFLLLQLPVLSVEVTRRIEGSRSLPLNYINRAVAQGITKLGEYPNIKRVLATNLLELIVPAMGGKDVYSAHRSLTWKYPEKVQNVHKFYHFLLSPEEAAEFLTTNNIDAVVWQQGMTNPEKVLSTYPFLTLLYQNEQLSVYVTHE